MLSIGEGKNNLQVSSFKAISMQNNAAMNMMQINQNNQSMLRASKANDMNFILDEAPIKAIFTTGAKADDLYKKMCYPICGVSSIRLPSTSPANCSCSYEKLIEGYSQILKYIR